MWQTTKFSVSAIQGQSAKFKFSGYTVMHILTVLLFQVGFINFSPYYRNPEQPVERVVDSAGIVTLTCSEDILSGDTAQKVR